MAVQRGAPTTGMTVSLVLFVFLFVISAALAILFYVQRSDAQTKLAQWQKVIELYAPEEIRTNPDPALAKVLTEAKKPGKDESVVGLLLQEKQSLAKLLTGEEDDSVEKAREKLANRAGLKQGEYTSVLNVLQGREKQVAKLKKKLQEEFGKKKAAEFTDLLGKRKLAQLGIRLVQEHASVRTDLVATRKELEAANKKLAEAKKKVEALDQRIRKIQKQNESYQQTADEQQQALEARLDKIQAECEKKLSNLRNKLRDTKAKLANREARIDRLESQLVTPTPSGSPTADGQIISVAPEEQLVHINRGRQDHLVLGMTFEVFSSESAMEVSGQGNRLNRGKATIQVVELSKSTATARVIRSYVDQPVLEDDVIANLAYDPERVFKFYLYGKKFDLNQDGRATSYERERIISLIRQWGGKVTDRLSLDTDYLVVGQAPKKPGPKPPNPSPSEIIQREEQLKAYKKFQDIRQEAKELSIPVLNQNRFLALVGQL